MRVDHHGVGNRERLTVHDDASRGVKELHPLIGNEAHAWVLGNPRAVLVEVCNNLTGLAAVMHTVGLLLAVEAVRDPLRDLQAHFLGSALDSRQVG